MSVPEIRSCDVQAAIADIEKNGVPRARRSTRFCLNVKGRHYPPKYILALAVQHATGKGLAATDHSGGSETNTRLARLGLQIVNCDCGGLSQHSSLTGERRAMIARIVLDGPPLNHSFDRKRMLAVAERVLLRTFSSWPDELSTKIVITPGGFLNLTAPAHVFGSAGWFSTVSDIRDAKQAAEQVLQLLLTPRVLQAARGKTEAITIGVDINAREDSRHAELVAFVRIEDGAIVRWTGKSYPVGFQENTLIHETDLASHCLHFGGERVLILGGHDLNMFSPRGYANQHPDGKRRARCELMRAIVARFRPTLILQHPHTTDSDRIWLLPWSALNKLYEPSLKDWASGICFYQRGGSRRKLAQVLAATRSPSRDGLEFIFRTKGHSVSGPRVLPFRR